MRFAILSLPQYMEFIAEQASSTSISGGGGQLIAAIVADELENPNPFQNLPSIGVLDVVRAYNSNQIDTVVISLVGISRTPKKMEFVRNLIQYYKLSGLEKILVFADNEITESQWLSRDKFFLPYMNTNLIDGCNLNCKACTHFASLYSKDEFYSLDEFTRDLEQLSSKCDVSYFRLIGGEPFMLKNLDKYLKIARKYFPNTLLTVLTNGLLVPKTNSKIFDAIRENGIIVQITRYPPTLKIIDEIVKRLEKEKVMFQMIDIITRFRTYLRGESGVSNPAIPISICNDLSCVFLRHGKIHKCPIDGLVKRYGEKFPEMNIPTSSGASIYSNNFLEMLDYIVTPSKQIQMCEHCSENPIWIDWKPNPNPRAEDWYR